MQLKPITGESVKLRNTKYLDSMKLNHEKTKRFEKFIKIFFNNDEAIVDYNNYEIHSNGHCIGFNDFELYDQSFEKNKKYFDIMSTLSEDYAYDAANYFVYRVNHAQKELLIDQKDKKENPELWNSYLHIDWVKELQKYSQMAKYTYEKYVEKQEYCIK